MEYNNGILESSSITSLINHLKSDSSGASDANIDYFERSRYHDDVRLIVLTRYAFEYIEKINLGRTKSSIDDLLELFQNLEDGYLCNEVQGFDENFIKYLVQKDYSKYKEEYGNLSNSFVGISIDFYKNAFIISNE